MGWRPAEHGGETLRARARSRLGMAAGAACLLLLVTFASPVEAHHRYTALVDSEQGATFEPDNRFTTAVLTAAADPSIDRTIDFDGDGRGDAEATRSDLGNGNKFLDAVIYYAAGPAGPYVHANAYWRLLSGSTAQFIYPGANGLMAWFGDFDDLDGDDVIDETCPSEPGYDPATDEFHWRGAASNEKNRYELAAWIVPGNHTGFLADWPDAYAWPGFVVYDDPDDQSPQDPDQLTTRDPTGETAQSDNGGEGSRNERSDFSLDDRSNGNAAGGTDTTFPAGCPGNTMWVGGNGFATVFADNAMLRETVVVVAAFADGVGRDPFIEQQYDIAQAIFVDVDAYDSVNPTVADLYEGLSEDSRGAIASANEDWCVDTCAAVKPLMDVVLPAREGEVKPAPEVVNKALPPAEHEPNHPDDAYSGAIYGGDAFSGSCSSDSIAQPRGACNLYNVFQTDWRLWLDVQAYSAVCACRPFTGGAYGPVFIGDNVPSAKAGRHTDKTMTPGHLYDFRGNLGQWFDKNADLWIGDVTGTVAGPDDPYFEGVSPTQDPNDYDDNDPNDAGSEFRGLCVGNQGRLSLVLEPVGTDGQWPGGLLRFVQFETIGGAFTSGRDTVQLVISGPVELPLECIAGTAATSGLMLGRDYVAFGQGSLTYNVRATAMAKNVTVAIEHGEPDVFFLDETVIDVDEYSVIV
ncbi:MAG: hypothetical protein HY556_11020 [Euryarchaeota archaeon]|nr:hypothetical protein [Euryarchaeota archaeon]